MTDEDGYSTNHLVEIGRIAVSCGHVESVISDIAAVLVDPVGDVGHAVIATDAFGRAYGLIRRLLPLRFPSDPAVVRDCLGVVERAAAVMKDRNRVLHSTWNISRRTATVVSRKPGEGHFDWPLEDLVEQADRAHEVAVLVGDAWMELLHHWGHLDGFIAGTQALIDAESEPG